MKNAWKEMTEPEVLDLVRKQVDAHQPRSFRLCVLSAHASQPLEEWVVFVDVDPPHEVSGLEYAHSLAEIEEIIEDSGVDRIRLNPPLWRPDAA